MNVNVKIARLPADLASAKRLLLRGGDQALRFGAPGAKGFQSDAKA
jgi:hypothetical protein